MATAKQTAARKRFAAAAKTCHRKGLKKKALGSCMRTALKKRK